ncbi:TPR domain-containing protein [Colletotrichum sojae]|uniref:TPR domain-containing protein n=1 Tax=Colletotrichum sojae TaxID=2175907 RepID=A0A8H6JCA9_9PEZI|nr:TPR domain-containing protein [Colletotrichum sojae]
MTSHQTRTFSHVSPERFDRDTPQVPYLVFNLGPGKLQRLVVKVWSNDQGWCDSGLNSPDPYANSHTAFALALIPDGDTPKNLELHTFQSNFRASRSIRCHTNIWNFGPNVENDSTPDEVHGWLESEARLGGASIGVYPVARYQGWVNFVWKMEVEVVSEMRGRVEPAGHEATPTQAHHTDRRLTSVSTLGEEESSQLRSTPGNSTRSSANPKPESRILPSRGPRQQPLDEEQEAYVNGVVTRIASRFPDCRNAKSLDDAIAIAKQAMRAVPKEHPEYVDYLNTLACGLFARFERSKTLTDLRGAISLTHEALDREKNEGPFRIKLLENLNGYLEKMFSHETIEQNIDTSVEILQEVLPTVSKQSPVYSMFLCTLAQGLYQRFIVSNAMAHLNEAISVGKDVIAAAAENHPNRVRFLVQASVLLKRRYLRDGTVPDLEDAIKLSREALNITAKHDFRRCLCLRDLSEGLHRRYILFNAWSDLEEAMALFQEAMSMTSESGPEYIYYLLKFGSMLNSRFGRTKELEDLEASIQNIRTVLRAVEGDDDRKFRAELLSDLGSLLHGRFSITKRTTDLDEAIDAGRQAKALAPNAGCLDNLGLNLTERFETSAERDVADLDEGTEVIRKGLGTLRDDHPHRAGSLINLGIALHRRFAETGSTQDRDEAMKHFREALGSESAPYNARVMAGQHLLTRAQSDQSTRDAFLAAKATIGMLDSYAPLSLRPQDKQDVVSVVAGIAAEAAAIALEDGQDAATALELLETGRGIIASFFHDRRADVSLLEEKHPDLARGFRDIRGQLDKPSLADGPGALSAQPGQHETDQRFSASSQMKALLATIRSQPDFERFLQPADEAEMRRAAAGGPIVVVNVSSFRCDALIIEGSGVRVLQLPNLTNADVRRRSELLRDPETLTWLWNAVVGPVLDSLGFKQPPRDGCWPRVWWIPTGPLVQFPLHAAGYHLESRNQTAMDRVVSSYSSSVKAIVLSRQSNYVWSGSDVVLVSMQETPGQAKLSHAVAEVEAVQSVCTTIALPCVKPEVTKENVLSALETCRIFHFAGHGVTDALNPLRSHLFLNDWGSNPLTAESLMEMNLGHSSPFLAYLSACRTGENANEQLLDENIHLANAFQLAGFRHVIGTLWEVDDELCADMARLTYEFIVNQSITDDSVSRGLHHATRQLRDRWARRSGASRGEENDIESERDESANSNQSSESKDVLEGSKGGQSDARGQRTVGKSELTSPLWVPYIHYGP